MLVSYLHNLANVRLGHMLTFTCALLERRFSSCRSGTGPTLLVCHLHFPGLPSYSVLKEK
jgi:hypothetical protein